MLLGLISFMTEDSISTGCVRTSEEKKRELARESVRHNERNGYYVHFGEMLGKARKRVKGHQNSSSSSSSASLSNLSSRESEGDAPRHGMNAALVLFAVAVVFLLLAALFSLSQLEN